MPSKPPPVINVLERKNNHIYPSPLKSFYVFVYLKQGNIHARYKNLDIR